MQTVQVKSFNYKLNYDVPSSVEEFDKLAKRSGATLDEANKNVLYRSVLNVFRDAFLHGLDEVKEGDTVTQSAIEGLDKLTGIERNTKITKPEVKDADGKITQEEVSAWAETEKDYMNRVFATLVRDGKFPSVEAAEAAYEPLAQQVISAIAFDPSKTARESAGPKKTPKTYYGIADQLIEMAGSVEDAIGRFTKKTDKSVTPADREGLAKAIWEDQASQKKAIAAGYAG